MTFGGESSSKTLSLISTQRPDLQLNRDSSPQTAMTFCRAGGKVKPGLNANPLSAALLDVNHSEISKPSNSSLEK